MADAQDTQTKPDNPDRAPPAAIFHPSLIKWHLGALLFFIGVIFLSVAVDSFTLKDYAASNEPLEYVFAPIWGAFDLGANLLTLGAFLAMAVSGASILRRHRHWSLPEFNAFAAVMLLTVVSLPVLVLAAVFAFELWNDWASAWQAGSPRPGLMVSLLAVLAGSFPWLLSQFKAWRLLLSRPK